MSLESKIGYLGLPRQFAEDPALRATQSWQAVEMGFNRLNRRVKPNATLKWHPSKQNTKIIFRTADFLDHMARRGSVQEDYLAKHGSSVGGIALSEHRSILINTEVVNTPLFVAVATAHEALHLNTGNPLVKALKGGQVACLATETFIEYCSLEALGLLKRDPSTLNNPALEDVIDRAQRFHNILSSAFGNQAESFAYSLTFGRIGAPQIRVIDDSFRNYSESPQLESFYYDGIISVAAGINAPQLYGAEDIASEHYSAVIDWTKKRIRDVTFSTVWKR